MKGFYKGDKHIYLSKLLNGGFARTLLMDGITVTPIQFDHNISLDEGLYSRSSSTKISTSTASARIINSYEGEFQYKSRNNESEKGIKYECLPKFEENWERNKKSHFVHYTSTTMVNGRRQTFQYAFSAAINAVKEILTSQYIEETYGKVISDSSLQVRTLYDIFLPTDELTRNLFNPKAYDNKFRLTELCIVTLYFLEKTFCLDQVEMESYDTNCASIIRSFETLMGSLSDEEWEIYLVFLYMLSSGGEITRRDESDNWMLTVTSQKKFYYEVDFEPISYQNVAIGDKPLNLRSNLMRIVEDINSILGYNGRVLTTQYGSLQNCRELQHIRDLYVLPNLIHSTAYNNCVKELTSLLYELKDSDKITTLEKAITDIDVDGSLTHCLAKEIIRDLYKTYPDKFDNYIRRCKNELDMPEIELSKQVVSVQEYNKTYSPTHQGISYTVDNDVMETHFVNIGYTFVPQSMPQEYLMDPTIVGYATDINRVYNLRNSPMGYFTKRQTQFLLGQNRSKTANILATSTYEIFVETINNIVMVAKEVTKNLMVASSSLITILDEYANKQAEIGTQQSVRNYYIATKLKNDLMAKPEFFRAVVIESNSEVTVEIDANLFVLSNLIEFLPRAVKECRRKLQDVQQALPEDYYIERNLTAYENLVEAARQLLGFFCKYTKNYQDAYTTPNEWLTYQKEEMGLEEYDPSLWYNFEDTDIFSFSILKERAGELAEQDLSFLNMYSNLMKYVGNTGLATIKDIDITAHVERKYYHSIEDRNLELHCADVWEPHTMRIKVSIPYAESLRLDDRKMANFTTVLPTDGRRVFNW